MALTTTTSQAVKTCGAKFKTPKGTELSTCVRPLINGTKDAKCKAGQHISRMNTRREVKPLGFKLTMEDVPAAEIVSFAKEEGRGEDQLAVDKDVLAAHDAWKLAGKPDVTRSLLSSQKCPATLRKRYIVPPSHVTDVKTLLDRAASFLKVRVIIASTATHTSGNSIISFAVVDNQERPRNGK